MNLTFLLNHPAFWLAATIGVFVLAEVLYRHTGCQPWLNPMFTSVLVLIGVLKGLGVSYPAYFKSAQMIHLLLGPATVALAVPLYANIPRIKAMLGPLAIALLVGSLAGVLSAILLGHLFGLDRMVTISFAPKSVTTPIAMALADKLGGDASLAAAAVVMTGVVGAMFAETVMRVLRVKDDAVKGFAIGISSHGAGTARAFQISPEAGAFSGLGMGLNGVMTSLLLPLLLALFPLF